MTVPQVGHLPLMALRPFFIVSSTALEISFLALHLTQYPSGIMIFRQGAPCCPAVRVTLRAADWQRQQANWSRRKPANRRPYGVVSGLCCRFLPLMGQPNASRSGSTFSRNGQV